LRAAVSSAYWLGINLSLGRFSSNELGITYGDGGDGSENERETEGLVGRCAEKIIGGGDQIRLESGGFYLKYLKSQSHLFQ